MAAAAPWSLSTPSSSRSASGTTPPESAPAASAPGGQLGKRLAQHVRSGKITKWQARTARVELVRGGKLEREIAEQRMIDRLAGIARLEDKRNPIGPNRRHLMR